MGQFALQMTGTDLGALPADLRDAHARFLGRNKQMLVTFGPIAHADGAPAGYAYQTDFPGTDAEAIRGFLDEDPLARAGVYQSSIVSGWRCMLPHRQPAMPVRPGLKGFFFHGIGNADVTERRNALADQHRAHLAPIDETQCLARGALTDGAGKGWYGSAMVYEFADRAALDRFFEHEPFRNGGLYARIDIYDWRRGRLIA